MRLLVSLWEEIVADSPSKEESTQQLFSALAPRSHRFFDNLRDNELTVILGKIKSLLNEPRSRERGIGVFKEFISALRPQRLQNHQENLLQILRIICHESTLHSPTVQNTLSNFLPLCKTLPDVLKELTPKSGLVGKILSSGILQLVETHEDEKLPAQELLRLLKTLLVNFRGSCGPFRDRLESSLKPYLSYDNEEVVHQVGNLFPLLSATGGGGGSSGGGSGSNHQSDWLLMVKKFLGEAYITLFHLYDDSCPALLEKENPFTITLKDSDSQTPTPTRPFLEPVRESKVFLRMLKLRLRLNNLIVALVAYLRNGFPVPKPVPVDGILKLVNFIVSVNPTELLDHEEKGKASRKEAIFLAGLLPDVHSLAFKLLSAVIPSVGTNIFTKASSVEQLYSQEFRWLKSHNRAFDDLRASVNSSLREYLKVTRGFVTSPATLKSWVSFLLQEVQLEKERVELHLGGGKKNKGKNQLSNVHTKGGSEVASQVHLVNGNAIGGAGGGYLEKSGRVCQGALDNLITLLPALDGESHKLVLKHCTETQVRIYQLGRFPEPFTSPTCRLRLNQLVLELCLNPHPQSPISLSLILTSLQKAGQSDPSRRVKESCLHSVSTLERLFHPAKQGMEMGGGSGSGANMGWDKTSEILHSLELTRSEAEADGGHGDGGGGVGNGDANEEDEDDQGKEDDDVSEEIEMVNYDAEIDTATANVTTSAEDEIEEVTIEDDDDNEEYSEPGEDEVMELEQDGLNFGNQNQRGLTGFSISSNPDRPGQDQVDQFGELSQVTSTSTMLPIPPAPVPEFSEEVELVTVDQIHAQQQEQEVLPESLQEMFNDFVG